MLAWSRVSKRGKFDLLGLEIGDRVRAAVAKSTAERGGDARRQLFAGADAHHGRGLGRGGVDDAEVAGCEVFGVAGKSIDLREGRPSLVS